MNTQIRFAVKPVVAMLKQWMSQWFRHDTPEPFLPPPITVDEPTIAPVADQPAPVAKPPHRLSKKRTKTQVRPDAQTFGELLESLEGTVAALSLPPITGNWLPKKDIRAIEKMGLFIPSPWVLEVVSDPALSPSEPLPMIASCAMIPRKHDSEGHCHPRFAFALKEATLPPFVQKVAGTPYRFGYCVELPEKERGPRDDLRTFWIWAWVVVTPSGGIVVPDEYRRIDNTIVHKHGRAGVRRSSFATHQWRQPSIMDAEPDRDLAEHKRFVRCVFRQLILWWNSRGARWSVGVRKGGKRATFSIAPEHTAAYFADREKTVASDGTAKKIIHYVREHTREGGSVVRAHVRGLRHFTWRGFECSVTAPKLNGAVFTECDLTPVEVETEELIAPGHLTTLQAASQLADLEDYQDMRRTAA